MKITKGAVIKEPGSTVKYKTGSWRTFRPVIDYEKCIRCGLCWSQCPDMAIEKKGNKFVINYDYCKGCGICAENCPVKAIKMVREEK
ncbi:MAG: 4Fe-4S binding protein [Candidatus Diapherotrites archaeon]|nr:4Fe-4S binding protein [Candidatus Diapherotrites archaeon]